MDEGDQSGPRPVKRVIRRVKDGVQSPEFVTDALQILKTVVAGTGAWWLSVAVLGSEMPFLAPWTALLTVHATVHRSLSHGVQTTVASTIGVGLSFVIGYLLGVSIWTFALALLVGVAAARISWIKDEGIAIATTAIFVLGSGFDEQAPLLDDRIIEVALGVGCGVVVNLFVLPPLRDKQAGRYVDSVNRRLGNVLIDMAQEFTESWETEKAEEWFKESEAINEELDSAWVMVRFARESRQSNPRNRVPLPRSVGGRSAQTRHRESAGYEEILERTGEGLSHLRHLTRTLREASYAEGPWDERFRERWGRLVDEAGHAIADPDAGVEPLYDHLVELSSDMAQEGGLPEESWPIYGSLLTSLRHIVVVVDDVASARSAREGASPNPGS